jgi:predicted nucleotidyltransferase
LTPLAVVAAVLQERRTPFAVIGAAAMAAYHISRSTVDIDLLVTDHACLQDRYWPRGRAGEFAIEIRRGDPGDPLAGVVRVRGSAPAVIDVVVGRHAWQAAAVAAAVPSEVEGVVVPIVRRADLVLLKLYAGGPQDASDIRQLLDFPDRAATIATIDGAIGQLPGDAQALWRRLRTA